MSPLHLPAPGATPIMGDSRGSHTMDIEDLRQQTQKRFLLEGKSGRGKTRTASDVALEILESGGSVLYVDTETEGSGTILQLIDQKGLPEDVVDELEYVRTQSYSDLMKQLENAEKYDLLVLDTLDHKHTYVLKEVADAKREGGADWNEYPQIYGEEKEVMRSLSDVGTNVIATVDPESGDDGKPKGAQTNIRGYFTTVVRMKKAGEQEWSHKILNWMGQSDWIGKKHPEFPDPVVEEIEEAAGLTE